MLSLLAGLGEADDYQPPGEQVEAMLARMAGPARDPAERRAEVTAFLLAAGGDG